MLEKENNLANEISVMWDQQLTEACENGIKNMPYGSLLNLINGRKEYNNMNHVNIHPDTIRSRAKQKNLVISQLGVSSPMLKVENQIVVLLIQMARMHQPLNATEALQLANDLTEGNEIQEEVIAWKKKHSHYKEVTDRNDVTRMLGCGYWDGFMRRNGHLIVCKRGQKFAMDRDTWSTYPNFVDMYNGVYGGMEEA